MIGKIFVTVTAGASYFRTQGRYTALVLLLVIMSGCENEQPAKPTETKPLTSQTPSQQPPATKLENMGLQLKIRLVSPPGANKVEFVEEIVNKSNQPVCFATRVFGRELFWTAAPQTADGIQKLVYYPEPEKLHSGYSVSALSQVAERFPEGGGAADGGAVIQPQETQTDPSETFTINRAGLFRLQSEWKVDVLDARVAPRYKVLGEYTLKSNALGLEVAKDIPGTEDKDEEN